MRAKICGITQLVDAELAVLHGAWALGFNFYPKSPRFIDPKAAKDIIRQLPASVLKVGIAIDIPSAGLTELMASTEVDLLQVYEEMDVSLSLKKRMILAVQASTVAELPTHDVLSEYGYLLLDSPKLADGLMGGTGRLSNWELATQLAKQYRLILAGGLNPENIQAAMRVVRPYAVDVASGVQRSPGRVDSILLNHFLRQVNDEQ